MVKDGKENDYTSKAEDRNKDGKDDTKKIVSELRIVNRLVDGGWHRYPSCGEVKIVRNYSVVNIKWRGRSGKTPVSKAHTLAEGRKEAVIEIIVKFDFACGWFLFRTIHRFYLCRRKHC